MKNISKTKENLCLTLLFVIPVAVLIMNGNEITFFNNICLYAYVSVYIIIATIYVKLKKDKNVLKVVSILVALYSIAIIFNYTGTYEIYKTQNNTTIVVEKIYDNFLSGDPNKTKSKFHKRVGFIFKKDLNSPVLQGKYNLQFEDDSIIITGNAANYFIKSYENSEENSYLRNKLKSSNFEIISLNSMKIYLK